MDKFLETIMNFINENTTLLIIICVFLILVLIGYLIDNSIKTKKLEKQMIKDEKEDKKETIVNNDIPSIVKEEKKSEIDPNMEIDLDFRTDEEKERDNNKSVFDPNMEIDLNFRTDEEKERDNKLESPEPIVNEVSVDPAINDLLLRDFASNNIEENNEEEISINPINDVYNLDMPEEEVVEAPKEDSLYKNDKKLSDIFKKKSPVNEKPNLEKTEDYSNELDKILKKLNEVSGSDDSTLDETTDFSNMF